MNPNSRRREGRYLLRTNLCGRDPAQMWQFYIQLVEIEAAFKNLKDDLALRPIFHQLEHRISDAYADRSQRLEEHIQKLIQIYAEGRPFLHGDPPVSIRQNHHPQGIETTREIEITDERE